MFYLGSIVDDTWSYVPNFCWWLNIQTFLSVVSFRILSYFSLSHVFALCFSGHLEEELTSQKITSEDKQWVFSELRLTISKVWGKKYLKKYYLRFLRSLQCFIPALKAADNTCAVVFIYINASKSTTSVECVLWIETWIFFWCRLIIFLIQRRRKKDYYYYKNVGVLLASAWVIFWTDITISTTVILI